MRFGDEAGPVTTSLSIGDPYVMPCSLEMEVDDNGRCASVVGPLAWMLGWDAGQVPHNALGELDMDAIATDRWRGPERTSVPTGNGGARAVWVSCEPRLPTGWLVTLTDAGPADVSRPGGR